MDADAAELEHVRGALLKHYGIDAKDIKLLDAGSTPNHHVTASSGEQYLVKALRSRLGAWVAENAAQITHIAAHACANGLATPAPIRTTEGALVAIVSGPRDDENTHLVVLEWAVGYQRADHLLIAQPGVAGELLARLGARLAELHLLPLPDGFTIPAPDVPGGHALCDMGTFLEHAKDPSSLYKGVESDDAKWFRGSLPELVDLWKQMPGPSVLCHGDPYLDNVLAKVEDSLPILMILDWEDACMTNPVVDLAACAVGTCFTLSLGEGSEDATVELVKERFVALIRGYVSQRPIGVAERPLLRKAMQACAWACGAFRYGRFLEGVSDLKTRKYGQLIEVVKILDGMGTGFDELAFS